ncbi:hypothetical protein KKA00_03910 [bacterium]|nr:hypothetical protein [bacterium]MBU1651339.1 hypothetical protein [bacterium]MBU1882512.1 hypothetical protein [bacterium]
MQSKIDFLIQKLTADNFTVASDLYIRTGEILRLIFKTEPPSEAAFKTLLQTQPTIAPMINRYFDVTPWHLIDAIITEQGETTIHDLISHSCQRKIASQL